MYEWMRSYLFKFDLDTMIAGLCMCWPWKGERLLYSCVYRARGETDLVHLNANPVGMRLIAVGCHRRSMIPTLCCCVHYCIEMINRTAVNNESSGTPSHHSVAAADGNVIALIRSVGPAKRNLYVLLVLSRCSCVWKKKYLATYLWLYTQTAERQYSLMNIIRSHRVSRIEWNLEFTSIGCGVRVSVDGWYAIARKIQ